MTLLVGLAEAAGMLEWDKRKLSKYRERGVFPKPYQQLASGPIVFQRDTLPADPKEAKKYIHAFFYCCDFHVVKDPIFLIVGIFLS